MWAWLSPILSAANPVDYSRCSCVELRLGQREEVQSVSRIIGGTQGLPNNPPRQAAQGAVYGPAGDRQADMEADQEYYQWLSRFTRRKGEQSRAKAKRSDVVPDVPREVAGSPAARERIATVDAGASAAITDWEQQHPLLTPEQERGEDLWPDSDSIRESPHAAEYTQRLVHHNLGLVRFAAMRFRACNLSIEELVSEGAVGLMRAAELFNPGMGHRFSTYACNHILQRMSAASRRETKSHRAGSMPYEKSQDGTLEEVEYPDTSRDGASLVDIRDMSNQAVSMPAIYLTRREYQVMMLYTMAGDTLEEIGRKYGICKERDPAGKGQVARDHQGVDAADVGDFRCTV